MDGGGAVLEEATPIGIDRMSLWDKGDQFMVLICSDASHGREKKRDSVAGFPHFSFFLFKVCHHM